MNDAAADGHCAHGRDGLATELRALALLALDRLEVIAARASSPHPDQQQSCGDDDHQPETRADSDHVPADPAPGAEPPASAGHDGASCPICAVLAGLRGGRAETAGQLAAHAAAVLAALRAALVDGAPASSQPAPAGPRSGRPVEHIPVDRVPVEGIPVERVTVEQAAGGGAPC